MALKVGIVVDSTADFPPGMSEALDLHLLPDHIVVDGTDHLDRVTIRTEEVIENLRQRRKVRTAPYFPGESAALFEKIVDRYDRIYTFTISKELSKNYDSTVRSLKLLYDDEAAKITVIDTENVSVGMAQVVRKAAELIEAAPGGNTTGALLSSYMRSSRLWFTVDSLEWLKAGGRVSGLTAFVGKLLNIKPIISLENGKLSPIERHRGKQSAMTRILELAADTFHRYKGGFSVWVAHADAETDAEFLRQEAATRMEISPDDILIAPIGATIAVHAGPGCVGLAMTPT